MRLIYIVIYFFIIFFPATIAYGQDEFIKGTPALAYRSIGDDSTIVIILHGGPGAAHNYLRPEWDLLSKGAKVIYYDQRGCGKSENNNCYGWRQHVQDLKRVIKTVSPNEKVILAGSSWGTILALLYADTYRLDVKGIILSGTIAWPGKGEVEKDCSVYMLDAHKRNYTNKDTSINYACLKGGYIIQSNGKITPALQEKIIRFKCFEMHPLANSAIFKSLNDAPMLQQVKDLKIPVLIFESPGECYSKDKRKSYLKDAARQFKNVSSNVEIYSINDACHDPWLTHSAVFFRKSLDFIDSIK